ncbi:unnamed protein product [Heligmosomoides polygyrus]|uniref:HTH_48 domain-containing protein n=1 Tax=Heligmosomoides polygyrus TaxID=6339 RepID=A0A183FR30_HELPZ|nr:unnamed protein product [Heligmosomoides polygyrus]
MDQGRIRTFVYYEWLLGNDTGTAVANICRACKERTVRRWFNRFESGDTSLEGREHPLKSMDDILHGGSFAEVDEVTTMVHGFFRSKSTKFYRDVIHLVHEKRKKLIENNGNYFV